MNISILSIFDSELRIDCQEFYATAEGCKNRLLKIFKDVTFFDRDNTAIREAGYHDLDCHLEYFIDKLGNRYEIILDVELKDVKSEKIKGGRK